MLQKFDSTVRLFDGDYSYSELARMDTPMLKSLIEARLANIDKSKQILEREGKVDAFSKKDFNSGLLGGVGLK